MKKTKNKLKSQFEYSNRLKKKNSRTTRLYKLLFKPSPVVRLWVVCKKIISFRFSEVHYWQLFKRPDLKLNR